MGVVQNMSGFFAARFFLGVTEGGLFPGVVFYLSMWYRQEEQHFRISLFFSAAALAGAFGGILAWVSPFTRDRVLTDEAVSGHRSHERRRWLTWLAMDFHP